MTKQWDNNNTGVLFLNDKQGNDKRPDWRGSIEVAGVNYWISGWNKESRDGDQLISLKVEQKQPRDAGGAKGPPARTSVPRGDQRATDERAQSAADYDDDIPF